MKKAMALAVLLVCCCFSCGSGTKKKESTSGEEVSDTDENWQYTESKDEMDNSMTYEASCISEKTVEFKFPYGKSSFSFYVRNKRNTSDVFLSCTNCQFIGGIGGTEFYRVKFDDESPISVTATYYPSDANFKYIYLGFTKRNLTQLKASKKIVIEAEFFQEGNIPLPFNTEGLKWADDR